MLSIKDLTKGTFKLNYLIFFCLFDLLSTYLAMVKDYEIYLIIDVRERTDKNERQLAFSERLT